MVLWSGSSPELDVRHFRAVHQEPFPHQEPALDDKKDWFVAKKNNV